MVASRVIRPIWRTFRPEFLERAAAHVRSGGHAVILGSGERLDVLLGVDDKGRITEFGLWSLLAIEQRRWRRIPAGVAAGLALATIRPGYREVVLDWCSRDSIHPGSLRRIALDCLKCGACCHDANVVLGEADLERWRRAGRADLCSKSYVRRSRDGKITLRFVDRRVGGAASPLRREPVGTPTRRTPTRCSHLGSGNRCRIYAVRPDNCSVFPMGSEACLAAREDTLGLRDGAPDVTLI